ncbi:MAG: hypothetical protein K0R02_730 [Rickettsiaceae bacterium]|jgi:hypothetical protein|nr:hypothetical protein [Rickettsiaceae bacterium]
MSNINVKFAAILNKDLEVGICMNAIAHMSLGLGAALGKGEALLDDYKDAEGNIYPNISRVPFIILRGKSNEIKKTIFCARESNLVYGIFIDTMREGTYVEQIERTSLTKLDDLNFIGCVIFGPKEKVSELTRKFSLWK